MERRPIYLDYNATTPLAPEVWEAMQLDVGVPRNPSSPHSFGREARQLLIEAREQIASFLGVTCKEILFTSGGTEGLNLLIQSIVQKNPKGHIISTTIEHASIETPLRAAEKEGIQLSLLPVDASGAVLTEQIEEAIRENTCAIVLAAANGETGVKPHLSRIARLAARRGIPLIVDGVALMGKEIFGIPAGVSAIAFSAHKFHGPKGVGCVVVRPSFPLSPQFLGGPQESGRRAGTENFAGIIGMAKAVELLKSKLPTASQQMAELRDHLERELLTQLPGTFVNGGGSRLPNTSNLRFEGVDGETLLLALDQCGIAASLGSACSSGALEPSRILLGMGLSYPEARSSLRFSLGRYTTREEIDYTIETLLSLVPTLR